MVLFVDACAREGSRSRELAEAVLSHIEEKDPSVERIRLYDHDLKPLTEDKINRRDEALAGNDFSDSEFDLARQFAKADLIIMAVPYWDLSFPAILKLYLESVSINGITFVYDEDGTPHGMCNAKKLYYVTTSGGEIGNNNYGYDYVKALTMGLFGVKDAMCIRAVGLDLFSVDAEKVLENAKEQLKDILDK
jgi:FMN-dependent NADH-azoreductase